MSEIRPSTGYAATMCHPKVDGIYVHQFRRRKWRAVLDSLILRFRCRQALHSVSRFAPFGDRLKCTVDPFKQAR